ncbi:MAG: lytic transglycosylase domain-containing protein [Maricaulaceae bacterium]|jgi:soluble lytic murein transglycosylase
MKRTVQRLLGGGVACLCATAAITTTAQAAPEPRLRPAPQVYSEYLSAADFNRLRDGLEAASRGNWRAVDSAIHAMTDQTARDILRWRAATSNPSVSYDELQAAARDFADWPRAGEIRDELESKIRSAGLTAAEIVVWFEGNPPESGEGMIALADALFVLGRDNEAEGYLRTAWREHVMPISVQTDTLSRYRSRLTTEDHIARVDYLLWREQRSAASRLYSELPAGERALAQARATLAARGRGVDSAVAAVPSSLQSDPALLYERARWRRKARMTTNALPLVLDIDNSFANVIGPSRVWYEREVHISRELGDGDYQTAYELAAEHGIDPDFDSGDFADAEWLAGWLALQHLGIPDQAAEHFARLDEAVSTPISRARALYWRGRAADELGESAQAEQFYRAAAEYSTAYYGQLAATELEGGPVYLPAAAVPTDAERAAFGSNDVARAIGIFAELDELSLFREFSYHLDDQLNEPAEFALLAELAVDYGQPGAGVRAGKTALALGVIEPGAAYPVMELPDFMPTDAPETAFIHALARQESEFYPRAVSPVGARGLMQMMPSTARATARRAGTSYRENWLTDDPEYNVRLGSTHLAELLEEFDGSYVLAAAAYNAGEHRARQWIRRYGDPRYDVDPIDWVEKIPFSETRNYVQRVMENVLVYRARLGDGEVAPTLDSDLSRGGPLH